SLGFYFISSMSFLSRVEHTQVFHLTAELDVRIPIHGSLIQVRPSEAGLASWSLGIAVVERAIAYSQVSRRVVSAVAINVINFIWPFAVNPEPNEMMLVVLYAID